MRFPLEVFDAVRAAFPARPAGQHARFRHRLGRGRLGYRADHRLCPGAGGTRLQRHPCIERRLDAGAADPGRAELSGAAGARREAGDQHADHRCRPDHRGFEQAEAIVGTGDADLVALARAILYDPRWPWHAAAHLGATVKAPKQYLRSQPAISQPVQMRTVKLPDVMAASSPEER